MKNILFVCGHLYSGTDRLISSLNEHPRFNIHTTGITWEHPSLLEYLYEQGHKINNNSAVYGDEILYNHSLCSKAFYNFTTFVFVIRSPKIPLAKTVQHGRYPTFETAARYYCYRLRRIYEMYYNSKERFFLTYDELSNSNKLQELANFLKIKGSIQKIEPLEESTIDVPYKELKRCEDCYEKYIYNIRNLIR